MTALDELRQEKASLCACVMLLNGNVADLESQVRLLKRTAEAAANALEDIGKAPALGRISEEYWANARMQAAAAARVTRTILETVK